MRRCVARARSGGTLRRPWQSALPGLCRGPLASESLSTRLVEKSVMLVAGIERAPWRHLGPNRSNSKEVAPRSRVGHFLRHVEGQGVDLESFVPLTG